MKMNKPNKDEIEKSINFLEELFWLMESKKNIKLKKVIGDLRELLEQDTSNIVRLNNISTPQNKRVLVGIFPDLFKDLTLFPTITSIIEFANEILSLNLSEQKKRSRTETIGEIICATNELSNEKLEKVVFALSKIMNNDNMFESIKSQKKNGSFSWNTTIQKLTETDSESNIK